MKDLGCANGWSVNPAEYVKHLECCGTEREYKHGLGLTKPGLWEMRKVRDYRMIVTNLGRCYNKYECKDCGIVYTVDSSD